MENFQQGCRENKKTEQTRQHMPDYHGSECKYSFPQNKKLLETEH